MNQHKRYSFFGAICVSFFFFCLQKEKKNMKMVLMGRGTYIERIVRERERESGALGG